MNFYEQSARVPLQISWTGVIEGGQRFSGAVSLVDATATILDIGFRTYQASQSYMNLDGTSLLPQMTGSANQRERRGVLRTPCPRYRQAPRDASAGQVEAFLQPSRQQPRTSNCTTSSPTPANSSTWPGDGTHSTVQQRLIEQGHGHLGRCRRPRPPDQRQPALPPVDPRRSRRRRDLLVLLLLRVRHSRESGNPLVRLSPDSTPPADGRLPTMTWVLLSLGSTITFAFISALDKILIARFTPNAQDIHSDGRPDTVSSWQLSYCLGWSGPDTRTRGRRFSASYQVLTSGGYLVLMFWVMGSQDVSRVIPVTSTYPIFVAILAFFLLGEQVGLSGVGRYRHHRCGRGADVPRPDSKGKGQGARPGLGLLPSHSRQHRVRTESGLQQDGRRQHGRLDPLLLEGSRKRRSLCRIHHQAKRHERPDQHAEETHVRRSHPLH